ncbi:MAG: response regulator [Pseudodesulfovibrio sp.]|uniref:Response regulator receiver n=1 Tax=Pseudodesulfovibrio aespoeensis (strain ATCC 700646 / DSM 10631 / Aspo-2) TaxID=643562 RepID=E6VXY9_PSEA9|nr:MULTISPECIES: response regulator [Pseudodesulfovibrio]MBU4191284.1 response regulator [Pseudomonadota bacterium]ADU62696.1 response regulator receiver [Pseudodesulfovibrio aespoeensis Aspo-2]MBU4245041.1 response regulator [Pseudomonadota bacterium]MBU4377517.1 response regulator [Pseudomonadota bacterium]MBU4474329.1 response regulator [Pseudomonadota bacterium]
MAGKRFLIVDDDQRFAELVALTLSRYADCVVSLGGGDAVLQFQHHLRKNEPFDAVIMDIEMPGMTGHEVVARMRETEKSNGINPLHAFKLIMLTAHKDVKNISSSFFRGGADAFIPKEQTSEKLVSELKKINLI